MPYYAEPILQINDLRTYYHTKSAVIPAVDGFSLSLHKREVLGIVGESGCGKSTVARSIIRLIDATNTTIESGKILFHSRDLLKLGINDITKVRGKSISMIFQNPQTSLNPVFTIGNQICEALIINERLNKKAAQKRAVELLQQVGIPAPENRMKDYPYQLSGGMQQRVMIAIALACKPDILIADEPTTALDVTIQAQILDLMNHLRAKYDMGIILITHNMGVVAEMCDHVIVMYGGVAVEEGSTNDIFAAPAHPYTRGLLAAIPSISVQKDKLYSIPGYVPRFFTHITQCRFASRCSCATEKCWQSEPPLIEYNNGHMVRCWNSNKDGD